MPKRPDSSSNAAPRRLGLVSQMISDKANALDGGESKNNEALIVPIGKIRPNPNQPRQMVNEERDNELAENIREHGVLEPLIVREVAEGEYEIVAGERRYRAAEKIGKKTLPVIVKDYDDKEAQFIAAIENLQRADLEPQDEARYFKFLSDNYNYSYRKIAEMVHRSHGYVNQRMRLLGLDEVEANVTNSEKDNNRIENGQKLENSQSVKERIQPKEGRYSPRPMLNFGGWLDKTRDSLPKLKPDEVAELRDKLSELRRKIAALEKELPK